MTFETAHTLEHLRQLFGPLEPRTPPSASELAGLRRVIPRISIEKDRIVLPLRSSRSFVRRHRVVALVYALTLVGMIAVALWAWFVAATRVWFLIHTVFVLPLVVLAGYRARYRGKLIIFPSSALCRVHQATLVLESFFHGSLFRADMRSLSVGPHIGSFLIRNARRPLEEQAAAAALLNRYALFGTKTGELDGVDELPILPAAFARWLLEVALCLTVDRGRLIFRGQPPDVLPALGIVFFWSWACAGGPVLLIVAPNLGPFVYAVSLALALLTGWGYRWEHKLRGATLMAGQRSFSIQQPGGDNETFLADTNPFYTERLGEDGKALWLVEPRVSKARPRKGYRIVAGAEDDIPEALTDILGDYLGFPPPPNPAARLGGT